ncbi:TRAP transporter small permease [Consotaella aegiceratis]|uniref:TRAP transporter small permease n=1 Tax=Consotaella aegiceratis TaxID=3097961 RepID=UPI002F416CF1
MASGSAVARSRVLDLATFFLAAAAGVILVLMVGLVCLSVVLRYFVNAPILGVNEIVQLGAVALVMLAMPWCTDQEGHVRADVFDGLIGHVGRIVGDVGSRVLSASVLGVLVYRSWDKMLDAYEYEDATNMLALPIWPFYGIMAVGIGLCVVVLAIQILLVVISGKEAT